MIQVPTALQAMCEICVINGTEFTPADLLESGYFKVQISTLNHLPRTNDWKSHSNIAIVLFCLYAFENVPIKQDCKVNKTNYWLKIHSLFFMFSDNNPFLFKV